MSRRRAPERIGAVDPPPEAPAGVLPTTSAIGYGPAGVTESRVDAARALMMLGVGVALGAVAGHTAMIAFDIASGRQDWLVVASAAGALGTVFGCLLADAGRRRPVAGFGALAGLVSGAAWIALINTGDTDVVRTLLFVGLAASVPALFTIVADHRRIRGGVSPVAATTQAAGYVMIGVACGAGVAFADPTVPWATISGVGGAVLFAGSAWRLMLPEKVHRSPNEVASWSLHATTSATSMSSALWGVSAGVAVAATVRLEPFLRAGWDAGLRYQLLTIALGGAVGAGVSFAVGWWHEDRPSGPAAVEIDAARLTAVAGASLLLVAASQTLPGTVAGGAIAMAAAAAAVGLGVSNTPVALAAALVGGALTTIGWERLVDAANSNRIAVAVCALPALVVGLATSFGASSARPAPLPQPDDRPAAEPVGAPTASGTALVPVSDAALDATSDAAFDAASRALTAAAAMGQVGGGRTLLAAQGVEFSYGSVQALFGVDLEVLDGEICAVVGANGAGKTTFLRTVAGLATPSAGSIRFGGQDLAPFSASDRVLLGINQIASGGAVAGDLTVSENLAMFGHTLSLRAARAGAERALEVFPQFRDRMRQRASSLSGGERQMLALSKSLVLRPRLLIVDELTLGLAPIIVSSLVPVIRRLHAEGASVLLVEQSVNVALELADRASCMEKGRIVYTSSADALRSDPGLLEAAYLEGISAALDHRAMLDGGGQT